MVTFRTEIPYDLIGTRTVEASYTPDITADGIVRVSRETKGRAGKGVTLVKGLGLEGEALTALAKALKAGGKVLLCERGNSARVDKGKAVKDAGAGITIPIGNVRKQPLKEILRDSEVVQDLKSYLNSRKNTSSKDTKDP